MSADVIKSTSQTDWERLDALTDEEIDYTDIPPLDELFFSRAQLRLPRKRETVTIQLDNDILDWFKAQDDEW